MQKMKESGIKWIGEIPETWIILHLKYVCDLKTGGTPANKIGIEAEGEIPWITAQDMIDANNITNYSQYITNEAIKKNKYKLFPAGSTLLCCIASVGKNGFITKNAYSNQQITALIPKKNIFNRYLLYLINAGKDTIAFDASSNVVPIVNSQYLNGFSIMLPTLPEQEKISLFLDSKCAEIDELHIDIQKQIEILEEYKKSVITKVVTKGLNPDVEMKDSGVEWIGEIPKAWGISRVKYLFKNGKGLSITKENLIDNGLTVISYGQIHSKRNNGVSINKELLRFVDFRYQKYYPKCQVYKNDFIFADTSEDYEGCGNCVYKRDDSILFAGYHSIILHSVLQQDNRYFAYLFKTDCWRQQLRKVAFGVKVFSITQKILINSSIIIPSYEEQQQIANYLDSKCEEIDLSIAEKKQQLEFLEQYKKSLIYEYVTGKKEVLE